MGNPQTASRTLRLEKYPILGVGRQTVVEDRFGLYHARDSVGLVLPTPVVQRAASQARGTICQRKLQTSASPSGRRPVRHSTGLDPIGANITAPEKELFIYKTEGKMQGMVQTALHA